MQLHLDEIATEVAPVLTPFSSSIKPDGMVQKTSGFQAISRSCRCRRARPNSIPKKTSGSPYVRFWIEQSWLVHYEMSEGCAGLADAEPHSQGTIHPGNQQSL